MKKMVEGGCERCANPFRSDSRSHEARPRSGSSSSTMPPLAHTLRTAPRRWRRWPETKSPRREGPVIPWKVRPTETSTRVFTILYAHKAVVVSDRPTGDPRRGQVFPTEDRARRQGEEPSHGVNSRVSPSCLRSTRADGSTVRLSCRAMLRIGASNRARHSHALGIVTRGSSVHILARSRRFCCPHTIS